MKFAKPCFDVGLATETLDPMLTFWQQEVGIPFDHMLPLGGGKRQHRHDALGSVVKINHSKIPLPNTPPTGYQELLIARKGLAELKQLTDPDGNLVSLVPHGQGNITQIAMRLTVRSIEDHSRFYRDAFGLAEVSYDKGTAFQLGDGHLLLEQAADAPSDAQYEGAGWRYITFQIFNADEAHEKALQSGGIEGMAPTTLGTTARISFVRDPDGNWIELSQRASLVGTLD